MENKKYIEILENFGKRIVLKNLQLKIKLCPLFIVETKSFAQLRKVQRDIGVKKLMNRLINILDLGNNILRVIEMGIMIAWHPSNLFGDDKSKWHPQDELMFKHSEILLVNLICESNPKKLKSFLKQYVNIFNKWKEGDKQRTIEGIIISYHHRMEHIKKIKNSEIDESEKISMIKTINEQLENLIKSLKMIDSSFPVAMLKDSHEKLFEIYKKSWESQFNNVRNVVMDSFKKYLLESIKKGEYSILRNEFVGITNRLLALCPKKIYKSMEKKLSSENIENIFINENSLESSEILEMILLIIDTTIIFDSPNNDENNQKWKIELIQKCTNLKENLPEILISINQHIDSIINQIKELAKNNKN